MFLLTSKRSACSKIPYPFVIQYFRVNTQNFSIPLTKMNFGNKYNFNHIYYSKNLNMEFNKKRKRLEEAEKNKKENAENEENYSIDESFELDENGVKRLNLPKKSKYRMRAHCNPLAGVSIA